MKKVAFCFATVVLVCSACNTRRICQEKEALPASGKRLSAEGTPFEKKRDVPSGRGERLQPDKSHVLQPGADLIAMLPSVLREVEFVTADGRFLMFRKTPKESFHVYIEKEGKLVLFTDEKSQELSKKIVGWFGSIKVVQELPSPADPEDVYDWFDKSKGAYLLYRTFMEDGYAQMLSIGNRTPHGEYYIGHVGDSHVYLIGGHVIDQIKAFSKQ